MRRQEGQAIVEFALVLPLFFLFFWGLVYVGLMYSDYLTLSNLARESARSASIQGKDAYDEIRKAGGKQTILTNLYQMKGENSIAIAGGSDSSTTVTVTVSADLNPDFPGVSVMDFLGMPLPDPFKITYSMYKEPSS